MTSQTPNPIDEKPNVAGSGGSHFVANSPQFLYAIDVLRRAWLYASDTNRDVWDFAVEVNTLQRYGLTATDFRWLAAKGYVRHGTELTQPGADSRAFRACHGLTFEIQTCFVLTDEGLAFANSILDPSLSLCNVPAKGEPTILVTRAGGAAVRDFRDQLEFRDRSDSRDQSDFRGEPAFRGELGKIRPFWDCDSRELRFQGKVVKQFKVPSPNQEIVIMSFEEERWPTCIDDPLPARADRDPKQRLHDTIRSLNRNQKNHLLRFKGNGTGQGIIWEPTTATDSADADENGRP